MDISITQEMATTTTTTTASSTYSLFWGRKTKSKFPLNQHVRNFALRRKKITPGPAIVQPLQVLALEAALLAGIFVDEEIFDEVSWLLEPSYPSFEHIGENDRTGGEVENANRTDCGACLCDACLEQTYDNDEEDVEVPKSFWDPIDCVGPIVSDIGSPLTQIERWAIIKLSTVLRLEFDDWRGGKEPRLVLASYAYPRSIPQTITIRLRS